MTKYFIIYPPPRPPSLPVLVLGIHLFNTKYHDQNHRDIYSQILDILGL